MFVTKSKLGFLYSDFCIEIEPCFINFYHFNVFLYANGLTVAKKLIETSSIGSGIFLVEYFKHLFQDR